MKPFTPATNPGGSTPMKPVSALPMKDAVSPVKKAVAPLVKEVVKAPIVKKAVVAPNVSPIVKKASTAPIVKKAVAPPHKKTRPPVKRIDRAVPFDEMRRLMRVYGSIKCLRKRQANNGDDNAKIDSVKRKFYRWFPDLDERFEKDEKGIYKPKFGHDEEIKYREEMRANDGKSLSKKRVNCRKERYGSAEKKPPKTKAKPSPTPPSTTTKRTATVRQVSISPDTVTSSLSSAGKKEDGRDEPAIELEFDHDPMVTAEMILSDTEPLEKSFVAEQGIFDDVEESFFGHDVSDCPSVTWSSCSSSNSIDKQGPVVSWDTDSNSIERQESTISWDDSTSIKDVLEKSMEECCEEILGSEDDTSVSGCLLDMITG